jgi:hypothetical protein
MLPNRGVDNPAPNVNGLVGEQTTLPYTVPCGKRLVLQGWGFEGLKNPFGVCFPWIGTVRTKERCLASVGPGPSGSYYVTGMRWVIPEGKIVNVRLLNGSQEGGTTGVVCAWFVQGYLENVE